MKIERWGGTEFSWDFDQGEPNPKAPQGKPQGGPFPSESKGCPLDQSRVPGQPRRDGNQMRRVLRFWFGSERLARENALAPSQEESPGLGQQAIKGNGEIL